MSKPTRWPCIGRIELAIEVTGEVALEITREYNLFDHTVETLRPITRASKSRVMRLFESLSHGLPCDYSADYSGMAIVTFANKPMRISEHR